MNKTGADNGHRSFPANIKIPVWLTIAAVAVFILILAFTVNHKREKDIVKQFSQQQMVIAKGTATGIEDLISSVEKSMIILSRLPRATGITPEISRQNLRAAYDDLDGDVGFIAVTNVDGVVISEYPPSVFKATTDKIFNDNSYFKEPTITGKTYLGDFQMEWTGATKNSIQSIIITVPKYDPENRFSGVVLTVLSLSAIIDRYINVKSETSGCGWIIDSNGTILVHTDKTPACMELQTLGNAVKTLDEASLKDDLAKGTGGYGEYMLPVVGGAKKSIIAYAPVNAGSKRWFIAITTPYSEMVLFARKGFINIMFWTLGLILVVIISGTSMAYSGANRLRLKEELKRLREREVWQEKLLREYRTTEGIIAGSPISTFVLNREHRVILWNRVCSELTGFDAGDMIGTDRHSIPFYKEKRPTLADIIIDHDINVLEKYYGTKDVKKSATVEGAYEAMDYITDLGGKNRYIYFLAAPIYDEDGQIIAAIETIQDVTSQKEMDMRLKEYAENLRNELTKNINLRKEVENLYNYHQSIINSLPEKIFDLSKEGVINYVSRDIKEDGGITSRNFEGKHFADFVDPENRQFVIDRWEDAKKDIFTPYEMTVTAKDGSRKNLLITPRPVNGTDRYILVQRDVTEFKALERKFYESQKLAAIGQLSAGIAHEVRNPLSSIKMSLQILEKRMQPEGNDSKRFQIAGREIEHLEKLVNDILIYAKPSEPRKKPSDIKNILDHAIAMTEKSVSDKNVRVEMNIAKDLPPLDADPAMLEQAFLNIYLNAIDAMEKGGKLSISARKTGDQVLVEVRDNGCGIAIEDMPHIFNPFFTKKKYGTGLGLTQIKKIIDLHRGTIEVLSNKRQGTSVIITFSAKIAGKYDKLEKNSQDSPERL